jgi:hypothetical protein
MEQAFISEGTSIDKVRVVRGVPSLDTTTGRYTSDLYLLFTLT